MRLVWGVGRNKVKPKHGAEQDALENEVTKLSLLFLTLGDIYNIYLSVHRINWKQKWKKI